MSYQREAIVKICKYLYYCIKLDYISFRSAYHYKLVVSLFFVLLFFACIVPTCQIMTFEDTVHFHYIVNSTGNF